MGIRPRGVFQHLVAVAIDRRLLRRGEEFLLILPGGALPDAASVGGRLLDAIARRPFSTSSGEIKVTASAGAASTGQGYLDVDAIMPQSHFSNAVDNRCSVIVPIRNSYSFHRHSNT